jgi:predicted LPLAT superfamily acyltransferase
MPEKTKYFSNKKQNYNRNSPQNYQNYYDYPQNNFGQ